MAAKSWLNIPSNSHFSLANLPFGIISTDSNTVPRPAVAIGDFALDLTAFAASNGFSHLHDFDITAFSSTTLNKFAALGRPVHRKVREYLQEIFRSGGKYPDVLENDATLRKQVLLPLENVKNHLPLSIGDYTDFYVGLNHAFNVGVLFRGPDNALQPNYKHLPVGYHGRASSIVVSGTDIRRPNGQVLANPTATPKIPTFSATKRLDIELELAAFVSTPNALGDPIPISEANDHIFGLVLMNDWSARDVQAWEYVPLGPFNGKNFGTTISPWVVLTDALEPFLAQGLEPADRDSILPYLREARPDTGYDIKLEVDLKPTGGEATTISKTNAKNLLFSFAQMLTHHSVGGCNMNTGDLLGSGTISGKERDELGSLLEMTEGGKVPIKLGNGLERKFLDDGDEVIIRGVCGQDGAYVGFGECRGKIVPARQI